LRSQAIYREQIVIFPRIRQESLGSIFIRERLQTYGWLAIAEGAESLFANERTIAAEQRLDEAWAVLQQHAEYERLTEHGSLAILKNGLEFSMTYFIMLLVLFFLSVRDAMSSTITG
jgi:hypothetical protein